MSLQLRYPICEIDNNCFKYDVIGGDVIKSFLIYALHIDDIDLWIPGHFILKLQPNFIIRDANGIGKYDVQVSLQHGFPSIYLRQSILSLRVTGIQIVCVECCYQNIDYMIRKDVTNKIRKLDRLVITTLEGKQSLYPN